MHPPVVLVHGIWDSSERIAPLREALVARGFAGDRVIAIDLCPNDGSATIETLAVQVRDQVSRVLAQFSCTSLDLVGFSMGALTSRYFVHHYGRESVRRFVSISGPHHGTLTALALPRAGLRQMRPNSAFLRALREHPSPWDQVELHTVWTPFDLMIVPARSSHLPEAKSELVVPVKLHRWMLHDRRVLDHVADTLRG
ncbi:MAG: alpha/beta fold hydrolase [Deltaproteobacteria bacterium]|nr:alpha/beta fold hydrolase [Deltaproteobacteria bacterium]